VNEPDATDDDVPRFSVVIPTYQRRDIVVRTVEALERQTFRDFEVVVVVDGSTDGTAAALRELPTSFPLTVLEQDNLGQAAARNLGASAAAGELLLFLDDDMEADAAMLGEHDRSHREGAGMVLGHLPLHPDSPHTVLSSGVERWAERRRERLSRESEVPVADLLTGQLSIARETFERLGAFDAGFTRGGLFGGEDLDFGHRVKRAGIPIVFNEAARSHQLWMVDPTEYLTRAREAGRSGEELKGKHPELWQAHDPALEFNAWRSRVVFGALGAAPTGLRRPVLTFAAHRVRSGHLDRTTRKLFNALRTMEYRRGAREAARRLRSAQAVVLAYHSISDLSHDLILSDYAVPPERLEEQLDGLARQGHRFVSLDELLRALDGSHELPERSVLLTFDDAYEDFRSACAPILAERQLTAVVFAVTDQIGGTNAWDRALGATSLQLLDEQGLREIAAAGFVVGSHGATHTRLPDLPVHELGRELLGSAERLVSIGLPRPAVFSYPHGQWTPEVAAAVSDAGYAAAFSITPGLVRRTENRFALPRIEVLATDTARTLRLKLATASLPARARPRLLRLARVR
jgi:peptidoglycan/xylan/chitin deacetylase (PgdA/CDA1 family)/GT2 family glycosyltransferase